MVHFYEQNVLAKTINLTFMYLLALFIVQNFKQIFEVDSDV